MKRKVILIWKKDETCYYCGGSGDDDGEICASCGGSGRTNV